MKTEPVKMENTSETSLRPFVEATPLVQEDAILPLFTSISAELWKHIFTFTPIDAVGRFAQTCKTCLQLTLDFGLYGELFNRAYPEVWSQLADQAKENWIATHQRALTNDISHLFSYAGGVGFRCYDHDRDAIDVDGERGIIAAAYRCNVQLWHAATGKKLHRLTSPSSSPVFCCAIDDGIVVAGRWYSVDVWSVDTGQLLHSLSADDNPQRRSGRGWGEKVERCAITRQHIAATTQYSSLFIWDRTSGQRVAEDRQNQLHRSTLCVVDNILLSPIEYSDNRYFDESQDTNIRSWTSRQANTARERINQSRYPKRVSFATGSRLGRYYKHHGYKENILECGACTDSGLTVVADEDGRLSVGLQGANSALKTWATECTDVNVQMKDGLVYTWKTEENELKIWHPLTGSLLQTLRSEHPIKRIYWISNRIIIRAGTYFYENEECSPALHLYTRKNVYQPKLYPATPNLADRQQTWDGYDAAAAGILGIAALPVVAAMALIGVVLAKR